MALYTDQLAEDGGDWAIRGIGLLDADRRMADVLDSQEHLYTLIERDSSGSRPRVVGSIVDYALVAGDPVAPIVDHVLRTGTGRGIQALVVYPMNALANSQLGELEKFLSIGPPGSTNLVSYRLQLVSPCGA
jgi:hypothetical protein